MADQDFELPPGYTYAPPDAQPDAAVAPTGTAPGAASQATPPAPSGYTLPSGYTYAPQSAQPDAPQQPQPYQGRLLPFSTNAAGQTYFDPHAGILGSALDALKLPGDVWTGQQPVPLSSQGYLNDPALMQRVENLTSFITPTPAASRANLPRSIGPPPPGVSTKYYPIVPPGAGVPGALIPGMRVSQALPTAGALKAEVDAGYAAARANQVPLPSSMVANYATAIQQNLQDPYGLGLSPKTAPKTFDVLDDLINPTNPTTYYTVLDAARRELNGIKTNPLMGGTDKFAAQQVIPHIDNIIDAVSPEAATARANAAALARSDEVTGLQAKAEGSAAAANSGMNLDNRLRQTVNSFIQNPDNLRGYSDAEVAALRSFTQGDFSRNTLRTVSNILGGGGGLGRLATGTVGAYLGHSLGMGEVGTALGASALPTVGATLKGVQNALASGRMGLIDELIRSRSPLGQQYVNQGVMTPNFSFGSQLPYRAVPPALLSSPPPQQSQPVPGRYPPLPTTGPIPAGLLGPWA